MSFDIRDIATAYRKAKVDLYYSSSPSIMKIYEYEKTLESNLTALLTKISGETESWTSEAAFLGTFTFTPKSISMPTPDAEMNGVQFSNPALRWQAATQATGSSKTRPAAEFRMTAQCTIEFHVLSTLWMLKVGEKFDAKLTDSAYGNRLRRRSDRQVNLLSLGSFMPYLAPFQRWRDKGLNAMNNALAEGKKVVALTADVTSFYHRLNPSFMLDDSFATMLGVDLSSDERKLNRLFVEALIAWAKSSPLGMGLPVGLPASAIVANMALIELDRIVEKEVVPLYYGRYVDDIMLVMENGSKFKSSSEVWEWLFRRSDGQLADEKGADSKNSIGVRFNSKFVKESNICFSNNKNKVFLLEGDSGKVLVASIARQVHERASEWRSLPNLPSGASAVATDMVAATQIDGELVDNLRKADSLTMRRAGFALKLRSFEAYERDLEPSAWESHRIAFYKAFIEHVLILPNFFDLASYVPRVLKLATASKDFEYLAAIIKAIIKIEGEIESHCVVTVKAAEGNGIAKSTVLSSWKSYLHSSISETILSALPHALLAPAQADWDDQMSGFEELYIHYWKVDQLRSTHKRLLDHDLAHVPRRFSSLPTELVGSRGMRIDDCVSTSNVEVLLGTQVSKGMDALGRWLEWGSKGIPLGIAFSTRPFNLAELYMIADEPFEAKSQDDLNSVVLALRGFPITGKMPQFENDVSDHAQRTLVVESKTRSDRKRIALASWRTSYDSWTASVMQISDPNRDRYHRLINLVNQVISRPAGINYLLFPELAIPARWFIRIAQKLQARGISLIAGIEYLHDGSGGVRNQIWSSLGHDGLGFSTMMIYQQDKQRPALGEEQELQRLAGLALRPRQSWASPPVVRHGDFTFSMLVCSELTNINYRASLGGRVDALFVPEWNRDIHTFDSLVEATSLDMHAYIVQCNDRQFGDSRIRAPYKESWRRDIVQIKGGLSDYIVVGEIDVEGLRQFQSTHRSPSGPFKPVPDGFIVSKDRIRLPKTESHSSWSGLSSERSSSGWIAS